MRRVLSRTASSLWNRSSSVESISAVETADVFAPVSAALLEMADGPGRHFICDIGFLTPMVALLRPGAASEEVQTHITRVLAKLAGSDLSRDAVSSSGCIKPLLRFLELGVDSSLAQAAAEALRNLALSPEMKETLREAGVLRPLISMLEAESESENTRSARWSIGICRNLATSSANQDALRKAGAIMPLVSYLRQADVNVSARAAAALSNLAVNNVLQPLKRCLCCSRSC